MNETPPEPSTVDKHLLLKSYYLSNTDRLNESVSYPTLLLKLFKIGITSG